jgi:ribose-phosphate pyrophosphokinase
MERFVVFSGQATPRLAEAVARELGLTLAPCTIARFPDGEVGVELHETVTRREVVLIQSSAPPVDQHLMELLVFVDACRRAGAARVIAVVPYFGYARADRRGDRLGSVTAGVIAQMLQVVGVDHVVTLDLHTPQIEGFFQIPVENLTAAPLLAASLRPHLPPGTVVVSPDAGRVRMAAEYARHLETNVVVLHKERLSGTRTHVTHVVGEVRNHSCLLIDDMISTGETLARAAEALRQAGAAPDLLVVATHGLFVADARERLAAAGISRLWVTDSVDPGEQPWPEREIVSAAPLLGATLRRLLGLD